MAQIHFKTELFTIKDWTVVLLPRSASSKLPSRGQVMIKGTVNGYEFQTALEPDGQGSHWFRVDNALRKAAGLSPGGNTELAIESTKEWTEPDVPADIARALTVNRKAHDIWVSITPMARREWIRWIRSTNSTETRKRRIEVACSKMEKGMRRPCCFNASMCTEPSVSKNGVLLTPAQVTK